jgi:hypothetical protein
MNQDEYGHCAIMATVHLCKALDEGKSPGEAQVIAVKDSGLTGFLAGIMASMVAYFHPRGEEFRKHWNREIGGATQEDSEGVLNPALITLKQK